MVRFALSLIFHRIFFCHTLSCFMVHSLISNSVLIQDGAKISKSLTKIIQQFYMLSKSVMKSQNIKIKCFSGSKQITIFLMNLNHNWNTFRWKMKIIFRMSKRRPFLNGTNGPILNVQKKFILGRVPTGNFAQNFLYTQNNQTKRKNLLNTQNGNF